MWLELFRAALREGGNADDPVRLSAIYQAASMLQGNDVIEPEFLDLLRPPGPQTWVRVGIVAQALRQAQGLSQRAMAEKTRIISKTQLGRIESLKSAPTLDTIIGLANANDRSVGYMFGEYDSLRNHNTGPSILALNFRQITIGQNDRKLAKLLNIGEGQVRNIRTSGGNPTDEVIARIALMHRVSISFLFNERTCQP